MSTDAIAKATGVSWADWVTYLDGIGGRDHAHAALAAAAQQLLPEATASRAWWSQAVAVAYEQHIERRVPGQRADGTYEVAVSRTFPGSLDDTLGAWIAHVEDRDTFSGRELSDSPTTSDTDKWRRWRGKLEGGRVIGAEVGARNDKSVLTVTLSKLASTDEKDNARAFLKSLLAEMH